MANRQKNNISYWILICLISLALSGMLYAHGDQKHVKGTVKSLSAVSITVETTTHETQTIQITSQTKFIRSGSPSSLRELKAGDLVAIHAKESGEKLEAVEVKFGAAPKSTATKKP
ncbi:MAG TPA: DUF5666 domain-containing protein [Verrucomicrobiae bacterium]|jgi:hypothetical protein|nr:DUF5666 domain-containing protein [Verrucomicrobiae bacterium]